MRIVFLVVNLACGGVERTVSYLSEYFAENGHNTAIICVSDEQFYDISKKVKLIKLNIPSACSNFFERIINILKRFIEIGKVLKDEKPDCVVCLDAAMLRFIYFQHKFGKFKVITSERNNPLMDTMEKKLIKYRAFRQSDGIVFQTERARRCFPPEIANKGVVIPNAVGNPLVFQIVMPEKRRKVITAAGRLTRQKDYPTMLKAFKVFHEKHPDFRLEIYGDGEEKMKYIDLAVALGIRSYVDFKGNIKDAIIPISTSSCFVMSSLYEGMPNALMEAMAVGVPCISTDCPFGPSELIKDGFNGILVPVGNYKALADAMCRMVENTDFAERCALNAKKILDVHNVSAISQMYLDYIDEIVKESAKKGEKNIGS